MADSVSATSFSFTYVSKYGDIPNSESILTNTAWTENLLPTLTHPGAIHIGWYTTETFEEDTKVEVGDTVVYTQYLYAKWESDKLLVSQLSLYDIAEAIRTHEGVTTTYKVDEFADAVRAFAVGTMTIQEKTYNFKPGMTWAEWVKSDYNTGGFYASGTAIYNGDSRLVTNVISTDKIIANNTYALGSGSATPI